MPEGERTLLENPERFTPSGVVLRPYTPDVLLEGGESLELAGDPIRRRLGSRPLAAHISPTTRTVTSSRATCSSRAPSGRTDLPGADWETLLASIRTLVDTLPPETVVYPGHGPITTLGDELARNPFLAELRAERDGVSRAAEDRAPARHARRRPLRAAAVASGDGRDRASVRALRVQADHDARVRGHGALRAHVRCRLGRRPEGDVHVRRPLGPVADAPTGGRLRRSAARTSSTGSSVEPQPLEALHDRADVPLLGARPRPLPRALAGVGRGDRERRPVDRRGAHPALRHAASPARRHALPPGAQLDRLSRVPPGVPRCARVPGSPRTRARLDAATREKAATSPLRVFDNFQAKPEAVRAALDGGAEDRRVVCAPSASSVSTSCGATSTRPASSTGSSRRSSAGSTTTRARPGSSSARSRTRTRRSREGDATTTSSRRSAARRRRAWASGPGSSGSCSRSRRRARASTRPRRSTSSSPSSRARRASLSRRGSRSSARRASRPTPTTRRARSRAS